MVSSPSISIASNRQSVTTIDDCQSLAQLLASHLTHLANQKYPFLVRRGTALRNLRKGVEPMDETTANDKAMIKAGSKTYFFDVKTTKEGKAYLVITESRFQGEGKTRQRVSLTVFPEQAKAFAHKVTEMAEKLA